MELKYLWDTNTAIYYLQKQFPLSSEAFMDKVLQGFYPAICSISEIELQCWKTATTNDLEVVKSFISDSVVFELDRPVKQKTIELRKTNRIKLPDAVIAATSLVNNLTLLTRNIVDFRDIPGLTVINPWEM
jgi:predicted nucleic acid-binding protein